MTVGKDVSMLFPDITKNMETRDIELKKLVYLYIINYAKKHPQKAVMVVNSFRKDAKSKDNPLLRALAVRTMGCINVPIINEYLVECLEMACNDEDSYVRKTAAICIAKLHDSSPELLEKCGFLDKLNDLLKDGNAMVVANAIAAYQSISESKGREMLELTHETVNNFLTAMDGCNEWGIINILDAIVKYVTNNQKDTEL